MEAWLNGVYTNYALACAFGENNDYPEVPIDLYSAEEDTKQKNEESDIFDAYAAVFNQQFK